MQVDICTMREGSVAALVTHAENELISFIGTDWSVHPLSKIRSRLRGIYYNVWKHRNVETTERFGNLGFQANGNEMSSGASGPSDSVFTISVK